MRNRIVYQSQAVFAGANPASGEQSVFHQLHRIYQASHQFNIPYIDIPSYGIAGSVLKPVSGPPTVSLNLSYYINGVFNETSLGFATNGTTPVLNGIINNSDNLKNYWITTVPEGFDAVGYAGYNNSVLSIGQGTITSWRTEASVGNLPTCDVEIEGLNMKYDLSSSGIKTPAIDYYSGSGLSYNVTLPIADSGNSLGLIAIQPGQIQLNIGNSEFGLKNICIQGYRLQLPLPRKKIQIIGNKYPSINLLQFPINISLEVSAFVRDIESGNLNKLLCEDKEYNLGINMYEPACSGYGDLIVNYTLRGCKLESVERRISISNSEQVTLRYNAQINSSSETGRGLFMMGLGGGVGPVLVSEPSVSGEYKVGYTLFASTGEWIGLFGGDAGGPTNLTPPEVSGVTLVGHTLTALSGTWQD